MTAMEDINGTTTTTYISADLVDTQNYFELYEDDGDGIGTFGVWNQSQNQTNLSSIYHVTTETETNSLWTTTSLVNAASTLSTDPSSPTNSYGYNTSTDGEAQLISTVIAEATGNSFGDDIALIDSAETEDTETDYSSVSFNGGVGIGETDDMLQHTMTYKSSYESNNTNHQSFDGGGGIVENGNGGGAVPRNDMELLQGSTNSGIGVVGGDGGNGGSSFMLLLEDFGEYFYNFNGSAVSGTTTISSSNLTDFDYRTNCTNLTSSSASCYDLSEVDHNYWALILILFPILTLFGNILVILSVCRERSLQTVTNYFIVSLAIADLLVAVVVMPFAVYVLVSSLSFKLAVVAGCLLVGVENLKSLLWCMQFLGNKVLQSCMQEGKDKQNTQVSM